MERLINKERLDFIVIKMENKNLTALVVDDEDSIRNINSRVLECQGYGVLKAEDYVSAIDLYNKNKGNISVVVTDIIFPERKGKETDKKNGLGLISYIKSDNPKVKIIGMSGITGEKEVIDAGADCFIEKPFNISEVVNAIKTFEK